MFRSAQIVLLALVAAAPAAAGFNDVLQIICDADNVITAGCGLVHDGLKFARAVAVSPDDKHVYVCSSQADTETREIPLQKESLSAYSRAADGTLTLVNQMIQDSGGVTTLEACRAVAVSPDGKHVYTAALSSSAVTWFSRNAVTGALSFTAGDAFVSGGPGGEIAGANAVVVSPDDEHVYVAGRSGDSVAAFSRDTTSGHLTHLATYEDDISGVLGLDTPEGLASSPDGKHLYVASELDDAVAVFAREDNSMSASFGELAFVEARFDGVGGVDGVDEASRVAVDPGGDNVYVASQVGLAAHDWLAVFSRNPASGALTFLQSFQNTAVSFPIECSGVGPSDSAVAVSASGFVVGDDLGAIVEMAMSSSADGDYLYTAAGAFSLHTVVDYECASVNVDLALTNDSVSTIESEVDHRERQLPHPGRRRGDDDVARDDDRQRRERGGAADDLQRGPLRTKLLSESGILSGR